MKITKGIVVIPMMGFANRLRFLASVKIYFNFLNLNFFIDWQKCSGFDCSFNKIFTDIDGYCTISSESYIDSEYLYFGHEHIKNIIQTIKNNTTDKEYSYLVLTGGHQLFNNFNQFTFLKLKKLFYNTISWNKQILDNIDSFISINSLNLDNTIAIHIRFIDEEYDRADINNNSLLDFNYNSPLIEFKRLISSLKNSFKIILFTNSLKVKQWGKELSKEIDRNIVIPHFDNFNRINASTILNSISEFLIMSKCKLIIGSYMSSFSDEASYFNNIPKIVVLKNAIRNDKTKLDIFKNRYHSNNIQFIFNNLVINSNSKILQSCFSNLS